MKKTYLMWVGSDHYKTIEEWIEETEVQGVSKRLPNFNVGMALVIPGTIVFVAHDEGNWRECPDCMGVIENPAWRIKEKMLVKWALEIEEFEKERDAVTDTLVLLPGDAAEEKTKRRQCDSLNRKIVKRESKTKALEEEHRHTKELVQGGTGGVVKVIRVDTGQQEIIDYRKYNYWWHQPKKFLERYSRTGAPQMCEVCGGKGQLPEAKIFGLFSPSTVEYILKEEDNEAAVQEMVKRGFKIVTAAEAKNRERRGCGVQKEGGIYAVTDKRMRLLVEKLIADGAIKSKSIEVKGDFIKFIEPISANVKRFRGIKKWKAGEDIEEEVEMIMDAME